MSFQLVRFTCGPLKFCSRIIHTRRTKRDKKQLAKWFFSVRQLINPFISSILGANVVCSIYQIFYGYHCSALILNYSITSLRVEGNKPFSNNLLSIYQIIFNMYLIKFLTTLLLKPGMHPFSYVPTWSAAHFFRARLHLLISYNVLKFIYLYWFFFIYYLSMR